MDMTIQQALGAGAAAAVQLFGIASAVHAVLTARHSQSAIAWAVTCVTIPLIAAPAYWFIGRNRFRGYVFERRSSNVRMPDPPADLDRWAVDGADLPGDLERTARVLVPLARMPFTRGNRVQLLDDGDAFFDAVFHRIEQAREYVLIQFFIVRSDALGQRLLKLLRRKRDEGVRVYFMYDQMGSRKLSSVYVRALRDAGVEVRSFYSGRRGHTRFQINFRNHRKIVLVDGRWAATGGANLGDEYRGRDQRFGYWRDTMVAVRGPAVQAIQYVFLEDWFYLTGESPEFNWKPEAAADGDRPVLVLPTGPADDMHACSILFTQIIHEARNRLWITSPYFVPDAEIIRALQLAALRGADVRILLPDHPDHHLVYWASFTYLEELQAAGVKFYRYTRGLLHEKVVLVDDRFALVGTANTDNRSFYLNFELSLLAAGREWAGDVEAMLERDFADSRPEETHPFRARPLSLRIAARLSRLLSPML